MKPTESLPILHIFPTLFIYFFYKKKEKNNLYETLYLFRFYSIQERSKRSIIHCIDSQTKT